MIRHAADPGAGGRGGAVKASEAKALNRARIRSVVESRDWCKL
jgi:hypothetical protein